MFATHIYAQMYENRIRAKNVDTGSSVEQRAEQPFSHPRSLIGDFDAANATLRKAVASVKGSGLFQSVRLLIQPMENCEGGLTQVEHTALRELGAIVGAAKVVVWQGHSLDDDTVRQKLQAP